jgi:hypothetical protein
MPKPVAILSIIAWGWILSEAARADGPPMAPRITELLWWLPEDTESLVVARAPVGKEDPKAVRAVARQMGAFLEIEQAPFKGEAVAFTIHASRRFRSPEGIGAWEGERAVLVVFDKPLGGAGEAWKDAVLADHGLGIAEKATIENLRDHEVVVVRTRNPNDPSRTDVAYMTVVDRAVMISSNSRGFLDALLARKLARPTRRAFPPGLPEWGLVDTSRPVWALRHYVQMPDPGDPSSQKSMMNDPREGPPGHGRVRDQGPRSSRNSASSVGRPGERAGARDSPNQGRGRRGFQAHGSEPR